MKQSEWEQEEWDRARKYKKRISMTNCFVSKWKNKTTWNIYFKWIEWWSNRNLGEEILPSIWFCLLLSSRYLKTTKHNSSSIQRAKGSEKKLQQQHAKYNECVSVEMDRSAKADVLLHHYFKSQHIVHFSHAL